MRGSRPAAGHLAEVRYACARSERLPVHGAKLAEREGTLGAFDRRPIPRKSREIPRTARIRDCPAVTGNAL